MPRVSLPSGRKSLTLLCLALLLGGAWWWAAPPREPVHRGVRLSEILFGEFWEGQGSNHRIASLEYLRGLPPSGVKWLAYQVEYGEPSQLQPGPFSHAPGWLRRRVPVKWGGQPSPMAGYARVRSAYALHLLGDSAAPAIPALLRTLHDKDERFVEIVAHSLHGIGLASWPAVEKVLTQGSTSDRLILLKEISVRANRDADFSEAELALVIDTLIQLCRDPNPAVRRAAVSAIHLCRYYRYDLYSSESPSLDKTVSTLIERLSDSEAKIRESAAVGVGWHAAKAVAAIPRLIELLDAPSAEERRLAAFALGKVDVQEQRSAPRLQQMLQDSNAECVKAAATALEAFARTSAKNDARQAEAVR